MARPTSLSSCGIASVAAHDGEPLALGERGLGGDDVYHCRDAGGRNDRGMKVLKGMWLEEVVESPVEAQDDKDDGLSIPRWPEI